MLINPQINGRGIFLLLWCTIVILSASAQTDTSATRFKINVLRMPTNELQFFLEKPLTKTTAIEYVGGLIYPNPMLSEIAVGFASSPFFFYYGIILGAGYRKYNKKGNYRQMAIITKYKRFDKQTLWYGGFSGSSAANEQLLSRQQYLLSPRITFGKFPSTSWVDLAVGFGVNFILTHNVVYGSRLFGGEGYSPTLAGQRGNVTFPERGVYFIGYPVVVLSLRFGKKVQ